MKKILLTILLLSLFFAITGSIQAAEGDYPTIVQDYPLLKACENDPDGCRPGEAGFGLPQFIKYIFIFSLGIVGIIGLLALIIAAFDYVMSAGNPEKAKQGKDKIVSALLGLLLLLASWVLLNLINPDLLTLGVTIPSSENGGGGNGEPTWYCYGCCYTISKCNLDPNNPLTGCGYLTGDMTGDEAATVCKALVDTWCINKFNSKASLTPCPPR